MKKIILSFSPLTSAILFVQTEDCPVQTVNFKLEQLTDNFWLPGIKIHQNVAIPASFERCESTGTVNNFVMAAARKGKFGTSFPFDDTDIYKTVEGAAFSLGPFPERQEDL